MEIGNHIKAKWAIRGDYTRTATNAWTNGTEVRLPNYSYGSARYDSESETILLSKGDKVATTIHRFDHIEVIPLELVECLSCGTEFQGRETCPSCGDDDWE